MVFLVAALLTNIFERKQEARNPYVRLVEVNEETTDPAPWGMNWSREYDDYKRTVEVTRTRFGGSEALPEEKAKAIPWLTRMFAGYAFAIDYRDRRGHAYMLDDQEKTKRVTERPQPGACLHCHASVIPTYRRLGGGDVFKGFEALGKMSYADAHAEVVKTGSSNPVAGGTATTFQHVEGAHPVSCVDCHDPRSMELRVTRPGFIRGIQALAASPEPMPHLQSIERWRRGNRATPYDPNVDATRQEMRSFVCGQCHVEYYCGPKTTLFFPWNNGLKVEQIESYYDAVQVPRRASLLRLEARRDRRRSAQGPASGVRDVEPGHPRAQRRGLRRLPHALQARGRDEGLGSLGPQPAAQHLARLPGVSPLPRDPKSRPASTRSRIARTP